MTIRWSAVYSSSLMRWLETKTVRPSAASLRSVSRIHWIPSGSRPMVGSSAQDRWIAEQRRGDAEALPHSERRYGALTSDVREPDAPEHLVRAPRRNAIALSKPAEVASRRAARMESACVEQRADDGQRSRDGRVAPPLYECLAGIRGGKSEQQLHHGRLPRAVRPDESGDAPGPHDDRQLVDGDRAPVALGHRTGLDVVSMPGTVGPVREIASRGGGVFEAPPVGENGRLSHPTE